MARRYRAALALAPMALAAATFWLLAAPAWSQSDEPASSCVPGTNKWADPSSLFLGDQSLITMVMTHTCTTAKLPIDLVFLIDESNSMTVAGPGQDFKTPVATRDPRATPTPEDPATTEPKTPPPGPGEPTEPPGGGGGDRGYDPCLFIPQGPGGGGEPPGPPGPPGPGDPSPTPKDPPPGEPTNTPGRPTPDEKPTPTPKDTVRGFTEEPAGGEDLIREAQESIRDFLDQDSVQEDFTNGRLRASVVAFNHEARMIQRLTNRDTSIRSALNRLRPGGGTRINIGMNMAVQELRRSSFAGGGSTDGDRAKVIIVYSDGQLCSRDIRRVGSSRDQIIVIAIGCGRNFDKRLMDQVATQREYSLTSKDLRELTRLYDNVLPLTRSVTLQSLIIRDELSESMRYVDGSANPAPSSVTGQTLEWTVDPITSPVTVTYRVEPLMEGMLPVSTLAEAKWTDSETLAGQVDFPPVDLDVLVRTPTPTSTSTVTPTPTPTLTATPSPTREPQPAYLPFVVNRWPPPPECEPSVQTVDVALIIDTSTSMAETTTTGGVRKIDAAVDAGLSFVELLKFPGSGPADQATVIGFNAESFVATELTSDRAQLEAALRGLPGRLASGTAIDKGLQAGFDELESHRHATANTRAIILVTDGEQSVGTNADVLAVANQIKTTDIVLWAVGLGADVDQALLLQVASTPDQYRHAPSADGLRLIYQEIARVVPCR
jgi:Mg-chelatase subunit ChlD